MEDLTSNDCARLKVKTQSSPHSPTEDKKTEKKKKKRKVNVRTCLRFPIL